MRARIAWLLAALTVVLTAVDIAVTSAYRTLLSEEAMAQHGFPFVERRGGRVGACWAPSSSPATSGTSSAGCSACRVHSAPSR